MSLNLRSRHYWQKVIYMDAFTLNHDGSCTYLEDIRNSGFDINYNAFTIDMGFSWQFAPGSEMSVVWKNSFLDYDNLIIPSYWKNLDTSASWLLTDHSNSISVKVLYYFDYQYLKKLKRK